nr:equilibrative nucleoside transporter 2-like [Danaus plexippus plexippus]
MGRRAESAGDIVLCSFRCLSTHFCCTLLAYLQRAADIVNTNNGGGRVRPAGWPAAELRRVACCVVLATVDAVAGSRLCWGQPRSQRTLPLVSPTNQWVIASLSVLRVVGVPLLMLCNAQPRQHLPVLFPWDYQYITIMIVFAFTNGYLTNIIMMLRWSTAVVVEIHEREKASSVIATMLSVGLTAGAAVGMLLVRLL